MGVLDFVASYRQDSFVYWLTVVCHLDRLLQSRILVRAALSSVITLL